nr:MAG TPA: hypothetical protein [Caudoviricetes sp.]
MANIFATLYGEAQNAMKTGSLYGSTAVGEATEAEVIESYMQYAEAAIGMERDGYLYAEATSELMERKGLSLMGAFFYAEAEGGFFKKIVNGLIKLYEKAKEFVIKLLGRFRSNKQYRTDLIYIEDVLKAAKGRSYTEGASLSVREVKLAAITNVIMGVLGDTKLLGTDFGTANKTNVTYIIGKMKDAIKDAKTDNEGAAKAAKEALTEFQGTLNNVDALTKTIYKKAIGENVDKAGVDLNPTSQIKPAEALAKLWDATDKKLTGGDISKYATASYKAIFEDGKLKFDDISKALDEGVSQYKEKLDELKQLLSEAESKAQSFNTTTDEKEKATGDFVQQMVGVSTQFSGIVANISTAVITAYNSAKIQLDKLIAFMKPVCAKLDELKKSSNKIDTNDTSGGAGVLLN